MTAANYETHEHDVLIIGAGGAGLRAAIEALAQGAASAWSANRCSARRTPSWPKAASPRPWPTSTRPTDWQHAFPRHHARRKIAQQLAHGPTSRAGSAGTRARTRAVGRAFRSHRGRQHFAARVRRPHFQAAVPRRRPHRPGDDPHAAGSRRAAGHRRVTWSAPITRLLTDGERVAGAFGYWREQRALRRFQSESPS